MAEKYPYNLIWLVPAKGDYMKDRKSIEKSIYIMNLIDHFDTALYSFVVPIISSLFFEHKNPLFSIIYGYAILIAGLLSRPLGAYYLGRFAEKSSIKALKITMHGMNFCSIIFALIPIKCGWISISLLILARSFQSFFASGETSIAPIYLIETTKNPKKAIKNYQISTMVGILIACITSSYITIDNWRLPYIATFVIGSVFMKLRMNITKPIVIVKRPKLDIKTSLKIAPLYGISYIMYVCSFILPITLVPILNKNISKDFILSFNNLWMIFDIFLIIFISKYLSNNYKKLLKTTLYIIGIISPVIFLLRVNFYTFIISRIIFISLGVTISLLISPFIVNYIKKNERFQISSISNAIGSELLGRSFTSIALLMFAYTKSTILIGLYISLISIISIILINGVKKPNHFSRKELFQEAC